MSDNKVEQKDVMGNNPNSAEQQLDKKDQVTTDDSIKDSSQVKPAAVDADQVAIENTVTNLLPESATIDKDQVATGSIEQEAQSAPLPANPAALKGFNINLIDFDASQVAGKENKLVNTAIGDYIRLGYRIIEGDKERIQAFEGTIIAKSGNAKNWHSTVTVRRVNQGYAVERVFPCFSPRIESVKVLKKFKIRRAKLFYLRDLAGKKSRLKEKL